MPNKNIATDTFKIHDVNIKYMNLNSYDWFWTETYVGKKHNENVLNKHSKKLLYWIYLIAQKHIFIIWLTVSTVIHVNKHIVSEVDKYTQTHSDTRAQAHKTI